jgi:hypothetical protein
MCLDRVRDAFWPRRKAEAEINPANVYQRYTDALARLDHDPSPAQDKQLLDRAQKLFDDSSARRSAIDSAAGAILAANGIVVSLIVGIGFGSLKDLTQTARFELVVIYGFFAISLLFLARAIFYAIRIGIAEVFRSTLGPDDIAPLPAQDAEWDNIRGISYDRRIAHKLIQYTIDNYKVNNIARMQLTLAQVSLRNGIMAIIIGGIIVATYSVASLLFHPVLELQGI